MSDATGDNPDAVLARESSVRSLKRGEAIGYRKSMMADTKPIEIRTPQGIILGTRLGYEVRFDRLFRVLGRIVKGLFYHESGYPLTAEYTPLIHSKDTIADLSFDIQNEMQRNIIDPLWNRDAKQIGEGIFGYRYQFFDEDPHVSAWGMTFYESIEFVAVTGPMQSDGRDSDT